MLSATSTIMVDVFVPQKRSEIMSRITGKHTNPEVAVRAALRKIGYVYRIHVSTLPGKPDIVIPRIKTAIFVNGCFWHQHPGCKRQSMPKTNILYWKPKLERNVKRQKADIVTLQKGGWKTMVVWECQTKKIDEIVKRVERRMRVIHG